MKITGTTPHLVALGELGRRIALSRKNQGMNQSQLAEASGLGVATVARIETGQDAQMSSWLKIFGVLGLTEALDKLLPEKISSPMAEVRRQRRRAPSKGGHFTWGDEQE